MTSKSCILVIDTAMAACGVAVYDAASDRGVDALRPMPRGQSEELVPMVSAVLADAGKTFSDIGLVVVTVGPGAFTGVRIALSAARAFGLALACPVVGMLSTECLAHTAVAGGDVRADEKIMALMDTKRGDFYAQLFDAAGQGLTEPTVVSADDLPAFAAGLGAVLVVGDCPDAAARLAGARVSPVQYAAPAVMARVAARRWAQGGAVAFLPPDPVYLRGAEVSQSKKKGRVIAENQ